MNLYTCHSILLSHPQHTYTTRDPAMEPKESVNTTPTNNKSPKHYVRKTKLCHAPTLAPHALQ
jgi:hypothetical protein